MTRRRRSAPGTRKAGRRAAAATAPGVTIREVARAAGVSVATVSRVVNGTAVVRDETRLRVEAEVARLRYAPNAAARSLITNRTNTVGVVLPDIWGEYFSEVIRGIDLSARQAGYHVLVSSSHSDVAETRDVLRTMHGRVDGVIVMSPDASPRDAGGLPSPGAAGRLPELRAREAGARRRAERRQPGRSPRHGRAPRSASATGASRFVTGPASNFDAAERRRGLPRRPPRRGPRAGRGDRSSRGTSARSRARSPARRSSGSRRRPTAIFAANDSMAIGVLFALRRRGRERSRRRSRSPASTTSRSPASRARRSRRCASTSGTLGERALARLLAELSGEGSSHAVREVLPIRLVLRESTGGREGDAKTGPPRAASVSRSSSNSSSVRRRKAS